MKFRVTFAGSYDVRADSAGEALATAEELSDMGVPFDATIDPSIDALTSQESDPCD